MKKMSDITAKLATLNKDYCFGLDPKRFSTAYNNVGPRGNVPYFFIPNPAVSDRGFRHCKIYGTRVLDYTVKKPTPFETLEEWANDCGRTFEDIRYGFESDDARYSSISILDMKKELFPVSNPYDALSASLAKVNLGFSSVYVAYKDQIIQAATFVYDHQ